MNQPAQSPPAPSSEDQAPSLIAPGAMIGEFGRDIMLWEVNNPRALVNLVHPDMRRKLEEARFQKPEYFDEFDEQTLLKKLTENSGMISATDNRLRLKFWLEYDFCDTYKTNKIDIARVCAGIVSVPVFYSKYLANPEKVGWLLCPPAGYMAKLNEALEFGLVQLRDILSHEHKQGQKLDAKVAEIKLKIVMFLDARKNGGVVQKTMNLHAHTNDKAIAASVSQVTTAPTMEALQKRLDAARREKEMLQNGGTLVLPPEAFKKGD